MPAPDVVVIGGGIMGCSMAWRLAREGASVRLLERGRGRRGGVVGGWRAVGAAGQPDPAAAAARPLPGRTAALPRLRGRAARGGRRCRSSTGSRGRLIVASRRRSGRAAPRSPARCRGPAGVAAELWSAERVAAEEPGLTGDARRAPPARPRLRRQPPDGAGAGAGGGPARRARRAAAAGHRAADRRRPGRRRRRRRRRAGSAAGAVVNAAGCWAGLVDRR